ncbi:MAG TPA: STAS domain-containing protein [Polyangiaceae bacterium]|nr:STAS domain-containing protein [Polyangiaceae bacterium]
MAKGHVTHAEHDGVHVLRYFGRVDYMAACGIQKFLDSLVEQGELSGLVFDLTDAEALDSTNLGLLARMRERVRARRLAESLIVSRNEDINDVLYSMGFDRIFQIVTDAPAASKDGSDPIDGAATSQEELRKTMLDAHRALLELSDRGRAEFQDVVACLEKQ